MGSFLSIWGKLFGSEKKYNILIVGLANAGKTTLLYQMYMHFYSGQWVNKSRRPQQSAAMWNK